MRLIVSLYIVLNASACSFDSIKLEPLRCVTGQSCGGGKICCAGFCVAQSSCIDAGSDLGQITPRDLGPDFDPAVDRDLDGRLDENDNCPDNWNPDQQDGDNDGVGNACDCAINESTFKTPAISIKTFSDPVPFLPIENVNNWGIAGTTFQQKEINGVNRATAIGLRSSASFLFSATLQTTALGDDLLSEPTSNLSIAGIAVRTSGFSTGKGAGYYCGIDFASSRVVIGKTSGNDFENGKFVRFSEPSTSTPGAPISEGLKLQLLYAITMHAVGTRLSCTVTAPTGSARRVETITTDGELANGGGALFTIGASSNFSQVKICVN